MPQAIAHLSWNPASGVTGYKVEYKKSGDSAWILFSANQSGTTADIGNLDWDTLYDFRIITNCGGTMSSGLGKTGSTGTNPYYWLPNAFVCEQDNVFTLSATITGLSSPNGVMYDSVSGMVYGVDADSTTGNFFRFNPSSISWANDITYYQPNSHSIYVTGFDPQYRRLYAAGKNTGGLLVFDIASHSVSTIAYGLDHVNPASGNGFNRVGFALTTDRIYVFDEYSKNLTIIDRAALVIVSTTHVSSIPFGTTYIAGATLYNKVGNEIWVVVNQGDGSENIGRYNLDMTAFLGSINISGYSSTWYFNVYWRSAYFDDEFNRFYIYDVGNSKMFVIDTDTNTVTYFADIENRGGKTSGAFGFINDPITNDLFFSGHFINAPGDATPIERTYRVSRTDHRFVDVYDGIKFQNLTHISGTNVLYGSSPGLLLWENGTWNTDGKIYKYTR